MGIELDFPWAYEEFFHLLVLMQGEYDDLRERLAMTKRRIEELEAGQPTTELLARVTCLTEVAFIWETKTNQLHESLRKWKSKSKHAAKEHRRVRDGHKEEILCLKIKLVAKDEELCQTRQK
ncbi:hypothetical protein R1flu_006762 [Riccia fluitans]|uniref:Uncharacterized protein n=1 Tax=Riccia fluitans TaxID=41844 RepID=A0ABD1YWX5_9MARC